MAKSTTEKCNPPGGTLTDVYHTVITDENGDRHEGYGNSPEESGRVASRLRGYDSPSNPWNNFFSSDSSPNQPSSSSDESSSSEGYSSSSDDSSLDVSRYGNLERKTMDGHSTPNNSGEKTRGIDELISEFLEPYRPFIESNLGIAVLNFSGVALIVAAFAFIRYINTH